VEQIFTLEIDFGASQAPGEALGEKQRCGAASVAREELVEAAMKTAVSFRFLILALEFLESGHENLGGVAAPVDAETARRNLRGRDPCVPQGGQGTP
jgi:hypothetical protein